VSLPAKGLPAKAATPGDIAQAIQLMNSAAEAIQRSTHAKPPRPEMPPAILRSTPGIQPKARIGLKDAVTPMLPAIEEDLSSECTLSPQASPRLLPCSTEMEPYAIQSVENVNLEERLSKIENFMADMGNTTASMERRCLKTCFKMVNGMRADLQEEMRETVAKMVSQLSQSAPVNIDARVDSRSPKEMDCLIESVEQSCFKMVSAKCDKLQKELRETVAEMASRKEIALEGSVSTIMDHIDKESRSVWCKIDQIDMVQDRYGGAIAARQDELILNLASDAQQVRIELDELNAVQKSIDLEVALAQGRSARAISESSSAQDIAPIIAGMQELHQCVKAASSDIWQLHKQYDHDHHNSNSRLECLEKVTSTWQNERLISKSAIADDVSEASTDGMVHESEDSVDSE